MHVQHHDQHARMLPGLKFNVVHVPQAAATAAQAAQKRWDRVQSRRRRLVSAYQSQVAALRAEQEATARLEEEEREAQVGPTQLTA